MKFSQCCQIFSCDSLVHIFSAFYGPFMFFCFALQLPHPLSVVRLLKTLIFLCVFSGRATKKLYYMPPKLHTFFFFHVPPELLSLTELYHVCLFTCMFSLEGVEVNLETPGKVVCLKA